eukprot:TRINITY_DN30969_c0_g1_i1.p1 TRINITY_DN30969_c0_g1~~TRINITY_DN30969_c0_g1_i1.p1  ORF type:complete len:127 (+),score=22.36 TRINITY_DN30969_c0_g1_i1:1-381(+)
MGMCFLAFLAYWTMPGCKTCFLSAGRTKNRAGIARRDWIAQMLFSASATGSWLSSTTKAHADEVAKKRYLPAAELAQIVKRDIVERQFLATADFSQEIYDAACTFTDEIDTYQYDKFITGSTRRRR